MRNMYRKYLKLGLTSFFVFCKIDVILTSQTVNFSKRLATSDPDVSSLVTELDEPLSQQITSVLGCASLANLKSQSQVWEERCSAFKFENGNCTLARTPPFMDKLMDKKRVASGEQGYFVSLEKPLSRDAHSDLVAYILINEEEYFNAHKNLPNPPSISFYDGVTKKFDFNRESPVKTREGHLAGTPVNSSSITMKLNGVQSLLNATICLWYNSGNSIPTVTEGLFTVRNKNTKDLINMKIDDTGKLIYGVRINEMSEEFTVISETLVPNIWYYISSTYETETGRARVYLNGSEVLNDTGPSFSSTLQFIPDQVRVGKVNALEFSGYIASFEIYDRALETNEISDSMERSTSFRVGL